jgi:hypothetical protein
VSDFDSEEVFEQVPTSWPTRHERCGDCMCCFEDECFFGPGSGCPEGSPGTYDEGRSTCPCTGD